MTNSKIDDGGGPSFDICRILELVHFNDSQKQTAANKITNGKTGTRHFVRRVSSQVRIFTVKRTTAMKYSTSAIEYWSPYMAATPRPYTNVDASPTTSQRQSLCQIDSSIVQIPTVLSHTALASTMGRPHLRRILSSAKALWEFQTDPLPKIGFITAKEWRKLNRDEDLVPVELE
jgi:hypothetical protein